MICFRQFTYGLLLELHLQHAHVITIFTVVLVFLNVESVRHTFESVNSANLFYLVPSLEYLPHQLMDFSSFLLVLFASNIDLFV